MTSFFTLAIRHESWAHEPEDIILHPLSLQIMAIVAPTGGQTAFVAVVCRQVRRPRTNGPLNTGTGSPKPIFPARPDQQFYYGSQYHQPSHRARP